jgi:universal stress protein A
VNNRAEASHIPEVDMEDVKRILVISRSTKYCRKAVHYGASLAKMYGAELFVAHIIHNPFWLERWPLAIPSLPTLQQEFQRTMQEARADLDKIIDSERANGLSVQEMVRDGEPFQEIMGIVRQEKIDLIVMLAHEEGRLEHLLFGRLTEQLHRKMPCSIMLVHEKLQPA